MLYLCALLFIIILPLYSYFLYKKNKKRENDLLQSAKISKDIISRIYSNDNMQFFDFDKLDYNLSKYGLEINTNLLGYINNVTNCDK